MLGQSCWVLQAYWVLQACSRGSLPHVKRTPCFIVHLTPRYLPLTHSNAVSIRFKSTRLAPTISNTLFLFLFRPLCFRSPLLFVSSICRRPPCLHETILARGEDSTILFGPVNQPEYIKPRNTYLVVDMNRADNLLSVCAGKPDRSAAIK